MNPVARCLNCAGMSGHPPLEGDGAPVCLPCLYRAGRAAASPAELSYMEAVVLERLHGDVVELRRTLDGWRWHWKSAWPDVGEYGLVEVS